MDSILNTSKLNLVDVNIILVDRPLTFKVCYYYLSWWTKSKQLFSEKNSLFNEAIRRLSKKHSEYWNVINFITLLLMIRNWLCNEMRVGDGFTNSHILIENYLQFPASCAIRTVAACRSLHNQSKHL